jgi:2-oxoglutarate dehydrogenase E2 component (dihydrolipoamide succinyltransferase)
LISFGFVDQAPNEERLSVAIEVLMPQMGQSVAEGTVLTWLKREGERVAKDEPLLAINTDKVDVEIPSPGAGVLGRLLVPAGQTVPVGTVLAHILTEAEAAAGAPHPSAAPVPPAGAAAAAPHARTEVPAAPPGRPATTPRPETPAAAETYHSPAVLALAREHDVDLAEVRGTGAGGRVTRKDLQEHLAARRAGRPAPAPPRAAAPQPAIAPTAGLPAAETRLPLSPIRRAIAEHMVRSIQVTPHVTSVAEVDVTGIAEVLARHREAFLAQAGLPLTYLPFLLRAAVEGLKACPTLNASLDGDVLVLKPAIHLGIAVATEEGLIVPVLKDAHAKGFLELARGARELAERARARRLTLEDVRGGTFTVNNFGAFDTLIGTPIIVQPQVAILGFGTVTKRAAVVNDTIHVRSMAYLSLSFDHRVIDGALAGQFLSHLKGMLQAFPVAEVPGVPR